MQRRRVSLRFTRVLQNHRQTQHYVQKFDRFYSAWRYFLCALATILAHVWHNDFNIPMRCNTCVYYSLEWNVPRSPRRMIIWYVYDAYIWLFSLNIYIYIHLYIMCCTMRFALFFLYFFLTYILFIHTM